MSPIKLDDYARLALPTVVLDPKNKKGFEPALLEALKGGCTASKNSLFAISLR